MRPDKTRQWLEDLLAGPELAPDDLRRLTTECVEGLQLDYKSGREFDDKDKARETLREYVSAFANSAGGILVVGYHEESKAFDGAKVPGGTPFDQWVPRTLGSMAYWLHPPPRTFAVEMAPGTKAFVVAIARSPAFVAVDVPGIGDVFYLRIGDSNYPPKDVRNSAAPPYLAADLQLGRRNQPLLRPAIALGKIEPFDTWDYGIKVARLHTTASVENVGLAYGDDVRLGAVSLAAGSDRRPPATPVPSLLAALDVEEPDEWLGRAFPMNLHHHALQRPDFETRLRAFELVSLGDLRFQIPLVPDGSGALPTHSNSAIERGLVRRHEDEWPERRGYALLSAAVYLHTRGGPVLWYQLDIAYTGNGQPLWHELNPPIGPRPIVGWRFLRRGEEIPPQQRPE